MLLLCIINFNMQNNIKFEFEEKFKTKSYADKLRILETLYSKIVLPNLNTQSEYQTYYNNYIINNYSKYQYIINSNVPNKQPNRQPNKSIIINHHIPIVLNQHKLSINNDIIIKKNDDITISKNNDNLYNVNKCIQRLNTSYNNTDKIKPTINDYSNMYNNITINMIKFCVLIKYITKTFKMSTKIKTLKHFAYLNTLCINNIKKIYEYDFSGLDCVIILHCKNSEIKDEHILNMPNINKLYCMNTSLSTSINSLVNLTLLNCKDCQNITDDNIKNLNKITYLNCTSCNNISDEGIQNLDKLNKLFCSYTSIVGTYFNKLNNIIKLVCICCNIIDDNISYLKKLKYLNCNSCSNITNHSINTLNNIKKLFIRDTSITINTMNNLKNITSLSINDNINLKYLHYLPHLNYFRCSELADVTDNHINTIQNLKTLICDNCENITDNSIKNLINLKKLKCDNCQKITNESIKLLINLKSLYIKNCNNIDYNGYKDLKHIQTLKQY